MSEERQATSEQTEAGVHDQFDVTLEDADLLGEVELTTNLIIAASESEEHLSDDEIDRILGVAPPRRTATDD
jgi:hypothetical protein